MKWYLPLPLIAFAAATGLVPAAAPAREPAEGSKFSLILARSGSDDDIAGKADFASRNGRTKFKIRIQHGPPGHEVEIHVGGMSRGTVTLNSAGNANVQFAQPASGKSRRLDFDPRGKRIEIEDVGDDKLLTSDGGATPLLDEHVNLLPTGIQPAASGHARLREKKGRREFNVEIEDVTDGSYDLFVDGVLRATITAVGGKGEMEFGDDHGGLPLDFDPWGKLIQVSQSGSVILTGALLAGAPGVSVCAPAESRTELASTGLDPDASGHADFRIEDDCERKFSVEVEDLPVGPYELFVAGLLRGTINVAVQPDSRVEGELEFSSDPDDPDELPLDFDPAGATIEIRQANNVFFSGTVGTANTGVCTVVDTELDMTNTGADPDAKGKSRVRQDAGCDRNFRVEVEKLPLGDYRLVVGGIVRGTIPVTLVGGEPVGHIEFDTEPDQPGEILLTFDPRGQLIEVRQNGTVFLNVTMPD